MSIFIRQLVHGPLAGPSLALHATAIHRMGPVASRVRYTRMNSLPAPQLIIEADILACAMIRL